MSEEITIQRIINDQLMVSDKDGLVAPIGINENKKIEYADYSKIANLLVCGTTGSGKTTFVRTLIASLATVSDCSNVKFCLFDSKGNDYIDFQGIPSLLIPVITDIRKCVGMLSWTLSEARNRLRKQNEKIFESDCPEIFVILDDYAEIAKESEAQEALYELLRIAHRVKIHVVIVTSIALAKIVSTELKVNLSHRIAFYLPEKLNSRVVLDQNGAESLEMPGEFIAKFYNQSNTYRVIELSNEEIKKACEAYKVKNDVFKETVVNQNYVDESQSKNDLLALAISVVVNAQSVSATMLQRHLKIGFANAARLVDTMEQMGIVGPLKGDKPREVLISKQQWEEMQF